MLEAPMMAVSPGWTWESWLWLVVPIAFYCVVTLILFAFGRAEQPGSFTGFFFRQVADSLERATGFRAGPWPAPSRVCSCSASR